jgi:hypothetical protein
MLQNNNKTKQNNTKNSMALAGKQTILTKQEDQARVFISPTNRVANVQMFQGLPLPPPSRSDLQTSNNYQMRSVSEFTILWDAGSSKALPNNTSSSQPTTQ